MKKNNYRELGYGFAALFWQKHSRLMIRGDSATWSLMWDAIELDKVCQSLGIKSIITRKDLALRNQSVYYVDRRRILKNWKKKQHRVAFPYYHGNPNHDSESREMLATISRNHREIERIQVTNSQMRHFILETGIDPGKVFTIPIGINLELFQNQAQTTKNEIRKRLGIPESAVVVGSFQKDGNGWEEGLTPKLIKGPDIFLETIRILKSSVPELYVLLTGPARGYVKKGLEELKIPYCHRQLDDFREIASYFRTLDLYIISSRDEGGPKAVLESMASEVPVVSTKVGQATDLIDPGINGFLADIEDAEGLAHCSRMVLEDSGMQQKLAANGLVTARENDYASQRPLWDRFFRGFVNY